MNNVLTELKSAFGEQQDISLDALRRYFNEQESDMPDATIRWRVHDMVETGVLKRIRQGWYQLGRRSIYGPQLFGRALKIAKFLKKEFPLISYCVWDSGLLNEFSQHLSSYHFILVDVERDASESVYYRLKEEFSGVFLRPSETLINDVVIDFRLPLIVRNLTTESPISVLDKMPVVTIEKVLVDMFCDREFYYLNGSEKRFVFGNAYSKYTVNESKLLRYAGRKGKRAEIQEYLVKGQFNRQIDDI